MKNTENILAEYANISDELDHLEEDNIELGCKELGAFNVKWCEENGYDPAKILDLHNNLISEYDYVILKAREQDEQEDGNVYRSTEKSKKKNTKVKMN